MAFSPSSSPPSYRVEAMKDDYLEGALIVANDFLGSGYRKRLCGVFPLAWFPMSLSEFRQSFATDDAKSTSAVALRSSDDKIVGFLHMTDSTMWRDGISQRLHPSVPGECYIEMLCVLSEAQGQGIGSKLLHFAEERARERDAHSLTLGVVANNPAIRLYQRFGFVVDDDEDAADNHRTCSSQCNLFTTLFCIMGCPHGRCGGISMIKDLQISK